MSLPNSRRALSPDQLRILDVTQSSERFRAAGSKYVSVMVLNHEEHGTSLPFLDFENVVLLLRSISNQSKNLAKLVDVIATAMMLVQETRLINAHLFSEIINAAQRDLVFLVNLIVICNSRYDVKAAAREIMPLIHGIVSEFRVARPSL